MLLISYYKPYTTDMDSQCRHTGVVIENGTDHTHARVSTSTR
jgi:hypothetical protein